MRIFKEIFRLLVNRNNSRDLLWNLSVGDLKKRYAGSAFGIIWAFIQPLVTVLVFWVVFQVGIKNPPVENTNVPYILWFVPAFIAWTFFNDCVMQSTNVFSEYSYLVKKIRFNIAFLPLIKIISSFIIHIFFIAFVFLMYLIFQIPFSPVWFQILYYSICMIYLLVGVAFIFSSVSVFLKDFSQLIAVLLQVFFWIHPIFWDEGSMGNEIVLNILKVSPLYYIITGYRKSFVSNEVFFISDPLYTVYFWGASTILIIVGLLMFKRLKPHFADVL